MKKLLAAALLALPLLAAPARAHGLKIMWQINNGPPIQLGPWYQYWPLEAHFQVPAPCSYPYWPPPMTLPGAVPPLGAAAGGPAPAPVPPPTQVAPPPVPVAPPPAPVPPGPAQLPPPEPRILGPANFHAPAYQPVGYYQQVPSYWYGR